MSAIRERMDNTDIVLPTQNMLECTEQLITKGAEDAIRAEETKKVIIDSSERVELPSYLIDITEAETITEMSLKALYSLLNKGDTAVYMKNGSAVELMGYGDGMLLYSVLYAVIRHTYNNKCKVYVGTNNGFRLFKNSEITNVRLNL